MVLVLKSLIASSGWKNGKTEPNVESSSGTRSCYKQGLICSLPPARWDSEVASSKKIGYVDTE